MCPTIDLKDNQPFMVVGTPGGTTIPTSVFQSFVDVIDFGKTAMEAIAAPKFHHQWLPDILQVESGLDVNVINRLKSMGYKLNQIGE